MFSNCNTHTESQGHLLVSANQHAAFRSAVNKWPHLVNQWLHEGVGSLFTEEPLGVVQEDLLETAEDVLEQQAVLHAAAVRVKERLV